MEEIIGDALTGVPGFPLGVGLLKLAEESAGRRYNIVSAESDLGVFIGRVFQTKKREITGVEHVVGARCRTRGECLKGFCSSGRGMLGAGVQLVTNSAISTRVEMAATTGHAITTDIHVPEQGLAELNRSLLVNNNGLFATGEACGFGDRGLGEGNGWPEFGVAFGGG